VMPKTDLVVAGCTNDASLQRLLEVAKSEGIDAKGLHYTAENSRLSLDPSTRQLTINGEVLATNSIFYRMQYFERNRKTTIAFQDRSHVGFAMIDSWAAMQTSVASFNKGKTLLSALNKPLGLMKADDIGLKIPNTIVSNVLANIEAKLDVNNAIAKPIVNGGFVRTFEHTNSDTEWINGIAPHPAIVQQKLDYPEYRIYVIGRSTCTFVVTSSDLDYREFPNYQMEYLPHGPPDRTVVKKIAKLAKVLGLDFAAADLKTNTVTDEIEFLEINSMPMFAVYDKISEGELNRTILKELGLLK